MNPIRSNNPQTPVFGGSPTAAANDTVISVRDIGKSYAIYERPRDKLIEALTRGRRRLHREFWALKGVSFDVKKGESVGIVGPNGSGKSTLLQILAGTLAPSVGTAEIRGRVAAVLELGTGFNAEFTGEENARLNAAAWGLSREEIDERFDAILSFADIGSFIHQPVKTYSNGMRMRLAFAVAANVDADVLIIDEALAVGDAGFSRKCLEYLNNFRRHSTLLFVSHNTSAVVKLCERAVLLEQGRMLTQGPAEEVCRLYLELQFGAPKKSHAADQEAWALGRNSEDADHKRPMEEPIDHRLRYINVSELRNDMEVFGFKRTGTSFGDGRAAIVNVRFLDGDSRAPLRWIVGGEQVVLEVRARVHARLECPSVSFLVQDGLGRAVFGDRSWKLGSTGPGAVNQGQHVTAQFSFRMPPLPTGDYVVSAAVGEGPKEKSTVAHWMHEPLRFRVLSSSVTAGLRGVPMEQILIRTHE